MKAPKQQGALPPLPAPDRTMWQYGQKIDHFTASQMFAYALAARDAIDKELEADLKQMVLHASTNPGDQR